MLGRLDQVLFGELESFGLALAALDERSQCRIKVLVAGATADRRRLAPRCLDLRGFVGPERLVWVSSGGHARTVLTTTGPVSGDGTQTRG